MNVEQIMKLIDAGYTKDEITALSQNQEEQNQEEQNQEEQNQEEQNQEEQNQKKQNQEQNPLNDMFASINKSIEEFDKKLKSFNANFTEMKSDDKMQTDEDLIAKIVQPSYLNKEEK